MKCDAAPNSTCRHVPFKGCVCVCVWCSVGNPPHHFLQPLMQAVDLGQPSTRKRERSPSSIIILTEISEHESAIRTRLTICALPPEWGKSGVGCI